MTSNLPLCKQVIKHSEALYQKLTGEEPYSVFPEPLTYNGKHFHYYDCENVIRESGYNFKVLNDDGDDDDDLVYQPATQTMIWVYDNHNNSEEYALYQLPSYNNWKLNTVYYCDKYGLLKKIATVKDTDIPVFEILRIRTDPKRHWQFVDLSNGNRCRDSKLYLKTFEDKYLSTLRRVIW